MVWHFAWIVDEKAVCPFWHQCVVCLSRVTLNNGFLAQVYSLIYTFLLYILCYTPHLVFLTVVAQLVT